MKHALFVCALLTLPGLARAQAIVASGEFSDVAFDYPAAAPNSTTSSLQGAFGQTFATTALPTNTGQNLLLLGFGQTGVPFAYLAHVALSGYLGSSNPAVSYGIISAIPFTAELWNQNNALVDTPTQPFYADTSGNVKALSWLNPAFAGAMSVKGPLWLRQEVALTLPANPVTGYPSASYTLPGGDANNDNRVDVADFGVLVNSYSSLVTDPSSGYDANADFNQDGSVDVADFGILVNEYSTVGDP